MKKCSRCSKPATLHITEVRGGSVQEVHHFCESCAHDFLKNPHQHDTLDDADALAEKLAEVAGGRDLDEMDQIVCPNCGISFREFRSQGRLGCPHDYVAFERELMPLLENIHGEKQHTGKFPRRAPDGSERQYRLIRMRNELRTAIEEEAYERAARLRDEIQALETALGEPEMD
ncbi:MAG: UvrB/UvrC motif-containing protein [Planctomycetes bacterium]|nr:UvrB/UvrC motif-containing protein [Planctomycetota bacterium]